MKNLNFYRLARQSFALGPGGGNPQKIEQLAIVPISLVGRSVVVTGLKRNAAAFDKESRNKK